jgi:hypothetical protein
MHERRMASNIVELLTIWGDGWISERGLLWPIERRAR